ncbi:MAG TPA: DinB family protein [Flavilitoribacter sp.]|nr:DinB family protein [Flavilitoribacter sp.]HMQ91249.1 DinB family protein [Flavilitoribacter sp.]
MKKEIISQYQAALRMLMDAIGKCPPEGWESKDRGAPFWRIAYHALFYTDLYLSESEAHFIPYAGHRPNYHYLDDVTRENVPVVVDVVYTPEEILGYARSVEGNMPARVNADPMGEKSGFSWLPFNRLELHLYNIRHIQHHTGQLIERLHQAGIFGIRWEGRG